ncbi:MAG: DUF3662 domain-containing protein [Anaerolineaceae bacterium]|nr:DUF3662 domain-containing protein [Anaerolineaceae bacterium]
MPGMNEQKLSRLEARLERLVEGAFAHIFGKKIRAQDIALELARSLEANSRPSKNSRPEAPDYYTIFLHPEAHRTLLQQQPTLPDVLSEYVVELAEQAGCKLANTPIVDIQADTTVASPQFVIKAEHSGARRSTTALMERVALPGNHAVPNNPQLVINGQRIVQLQHELINVGRSRDNHVILDDSTVSRHHLQLRLRQGRYILFDTQSQGGTFVNNVSVKQHVLQNSDVIQVGNTQLVYTEDSAPGETTGIFPAIPDIPDLTD